MGGKRSPETRGRYELRPHPTLAGLVVIWWLPAAGAPGPTNMTLGEDAVPLLAEALAEYELARAEPPAHRVQLRAVESPVPQPRTKREDPTQ